MEINDLKIYVMNATAIAVSMTDHIVVYTILKIRKINGKKNI